MFNDNKVRRKPLSRTVCRVVLDVGLMAMPNDYLVPHARHLMSHRLLPLVTSLTQQTPKRLNEEKKQFGYGKETDLHPTSPLSATATLRDSRLTTLC